MSSIEKTCRCPEFQRGFVLIMVLMLIILVSGLGLLAVRHSRQEVRSTGAYVDSTQAAAMVESAMAVAISDLRAAPDWYRYQFVNGAGSMVGSGTGLWDSRYAFGLSNSFFNAAALGCSTGDPEIDGNGCIGDLSRLNSADDNDYWTSITLDTPVVGPCPPGYSCFDDQNYAWYIFGINVQVRFGTSVTYWNTEFVETARAEGKGRVTIGPIGAYGN